MELVDDLIQRSRPRGGSLRGMTFIFIGAAMLVGMMLADPELFRLKGPTVILLPHLLLLSLILMITQSARKQRRRSIKLIQALEMVQLKQWDTAREQLAEVLRQPVKSSQARGESLLALAAVAESDQQWEIAQHIYEAILSDRAIDPLQRHTATVAVTETMLRTGQTTDAVNLIDRLDREELPEPLQAQVQLVALYREVTMGHAADALDRADDRRNLFRKYLGTIAGFGYALLAAAYDRAGNAETAARFWHDATLLVRPAELTRRYRELEPLTTRYKTAEPVI